MAPVSPNPADLSRPNSSILGGLGNLLDGDGR
jgi:hypothetical protein